MRLRGSPGAALKEWQSGTRRAGEAFPFHYGEIAMGDQNDIARVWDILESNSIGMLTTQFSGGLRARPLDARPDREAGAIFFVTDVRGHKDDEIAARPDVALS